MKQDAFERLVRPAMPALFKAAYRLVRNQADAQDLVQEVCIKANGHLDQIGQCSSPLAWLLRVLYHHFVDGVRQKARSPVVSVDMSTESPALASDALSPEALACQDDGERAFARAWLELDESQRGLLSLRAEGYGLAEISAITGIAQDVLAPRLHRARRSLKRYLDKTRDEAGVIARLGSGR
jgi:RNA polymerase sigma-70 factor (ECF subfamily)